jgi:hypothetical protein
MTPDHAFEDHYSELQSILTKIVSQRSTDFAVLFSHDKFMPFIDLFQKESVKVSKLFIIFRLLEKERRIDFFHVGSIVCFHCIEDNTTNVKEWR